MGTFTSGAIIMFFLILGLGILVFWIWFEMMAKKVAKAKTEIFTDCEPHKMD